MASKTSEFLSSLLNTQLVKVKSSIIRNSQLSPTLFFGGILNNILSRILNFHLISGRILDYFMGNSQLSPPPHISGERPGAADPWPGSGLALSSGIRWSCERESPPPCPLSLPSPPCLGHPAPHPPPPPCHTVLHLQGPLLPGHLLPLLVPGGEPGASAGSPLPPLPVLGPPDGAALLLRGLQLHRLLHQRDVPGEQAGETVGARLLLYIGPQPLPAQVSIRLNRF